MDGFVAKDSFISLWHVTGDCCLLFAVAVPFPFSFHFLFIWVIITGR